MVALLQLVSWAVGLLAAAGVGLGLLLLLVPEWKQWPAAVLERYLFPDANQITLNKKEKHGSSNAVQRKVYRVLCFGDSLTEGFTSGGINFHPYAKRLGDKIYAQLPKDWHLEVEEQGESGERVLFSMKHRLQRTLDEHADAGRHYDWVLLLGGINDLGGDGSTADEVLDGLSVLTEACLRHGANVLLMTVLEVAEPEPKVEQQRVQLNKLIKQYAEGQAWAAAAAQEPAAGGSNAQQRQAGGVQQQGSSSLTPVSRRGAPRVVLFDLASKLTWSGMDEETQWQMWDDGVHLTIDGYDLMGDLVSEALGTLVKQDIGSAATATAAELSGSAGTANGTSDHKKAV